MDAQWIKSPTGRRVLEHWADPRPAWLWSADGHSLLWRNTAARLFHGRTKGRDRGNSGATVPIRGQVTRLIRLGSVNRASLSRMQFLVGDRPVSATCACTPLVLVNGETGLFVVGVDPIAPEMLDHAPKRDAAIEALFPPGTDYLLIDDDGHFAGGSPTAIERYAPLLESAGLPPLDGTGEGAIEIDGQRKAFIRFKASAHEASLLLFGLAAEQAEGNAGATSDSGAISRSIAETAHLIEPMLPMGLPPIAPVKAEAAEAEDHWVEPLKEPHGGGLTSLFDRLADDSALFAPLRADEDFVPPEPAAQPSEVPVEPMAAAVMPETAVESAPEANIEPASAAAVSTDADAAPREPPEPADSSIEKASEPTINAEVEGTVAPSAETTETAQAASTPEPQAMQVSEVPMESSPATAKPTLYRIVGRHFTPLAAETPAESPAAEPVTSVEPARAEDAPVEEAAAHEDSAMADASPATELEVDVAATALAAIPAAIEELAGPKQEAPTETAAGEPLSPSTPDRSGIAATELQPPSAEPVTLAAPPLSAEPAAPDIAAPDTGPTPSDAENVERVSRYNFDELSRILNDRVGNANGNTASPQDNGEQPPFVPRPPLPSVPSATPEGALVTLGGETLVLNRLPLGILVFRDQQVLFANRAITQMIGYDSVENLRTAGLSAIFPSAGEEQPQAGPVNHLVQRDGALVPVTARLQSVSWQGKPALMLSASATEVRTGHEAAVRAFAELLAGARSDGFIEASRTGVFTAISGDARIIFGRGEDQLIGRPVSQFVAPAELPALREFLERPARFAETARPAITLKGQDPGLELMLFAQGQAGIVGGYFGFVRRTDGAPLPALAAPSRDADPALLARLSRGVRRPLNTVIGFSDLIGTAAFGKIENERYVEYARDIKTAGLEIAALVDELDDFARLRDGRYAPRPTDIDLASLLESSITRVRGQANTSRVLVRSAISERLPRIRADRASLAQAVLNLLASAIDQTPQGGSVVLSAQVDDIGGVSINVRDSAQNIADLGERFVVFRDGIGRNGEALTPVRSSVGLALTRALLGVNGMTLTVDPAAGAGTLFSVVIPPESVVLTKSLPAGTP